ncbi:hypothetical protein LLS1_21320 [Leifsonia sp. LS1]|uniref:hypothetical protein n=1 Tax=unclassified Leifsonia TaxID=2663824 RepID=UPI001CBBF540|nr:MULTISPECIES: hypothetical protein [unclassified Leifsonia]UAJ78461.1 hypothetical protein IT072_14495 [Leifsonia sp. ZF2019]GIT80463.1 hypothetical protein LLS1_21320 [Leifsonia sp. LS1]
MKKTLKMSVASAVVGSAIALGAALPAQAATEHYSPYYPTAAACGTAMASQQRAGRPVNGCYSIVIPGAGVWVPQYYFIYYT